MFRTWIVDSPPPGSALEASAVSLLLEAAHAAAPARHLLSFINQLAHADYISMVEYQGGSPLLIEGHAHQPDAANVTAECFALYRQRYYRCDAATAVAEQLRHDGRHALVTALHCRADELPEPRWRNDIYEPQGLADRLSFLYAPLPRTSFAINLYRSQATGTFSRGEIERLLAVSPLLRQVHCAVLQCRRNEAEARTLTKSAMLERTAATLARKAPQLSAREREVCARIACGMSADGIAVDLDIAPSTVVTLRKRAYLKLGDAGMHGGRMQLARWLS